jgi:hypothetical protein
MSAVGFADRLRRFRRDGRGPRRTHPAEFPITLVTGSGVNDAVKERAQALIVRVAGAAPRPVLEARITLRLHPDPGYEKPALAKLSLNVGGRFVHAYATAARMPEAVDLLERRVRRKIVGLEERSLPGRESPGLTNVGPARPGRTRAPSPR